MKDRKTVDRMVNKGLASVHRCPACKADHHISTKPDVSLPGLLNELVHVLNKIRLSHRDYDCLWCGSRLGKKHEPDCRLDRVLKAAGLRTAEERDIAEAG